MKYEINDDSFIVYEEMGNHIVRVLFEIKKEHFIEMYNKWIKGG